jgi:hypothetical protein
MLWLWSIKSGIEVGWATAGLGGGNPEAAYTGTSSHLTSSSLTTNPANVTSPKKSHSHLTRRGNSESPFSARDPPLSPLSSFNRRIGSPPAILGPHRPGVRERTWSSASTNNNARTRSNLPVGPGWDGSSNLDRTERVESGGDVSVQGLGLNFGLGGQGENPTDRKRSRVQSLGVSNVRRRAPNLPRNMEALPPPSDR